MAECRDFFHEPTSGVRRSGFFNEKPSIPTLPEGMEEVGAHCLELTLGLGPSVGCFQASSPPQVSPASAFTCLPKIPSGNFASSAPSLPSSDALQTSFSQFDAPKGPQNSTGQAEIAVLAKQRSGNFTHSRPIFGGQADSGLAVKSLFTTGDSAIPSRDHIWLTLQKNGAVSGQNMEHQNEAASMWNRRSASMHVMIPRKDVGDAENYQIRRSCSSGVFPRTISLQLSSIESSLDKSPQHNIVSTQDHDQEALEDLRRRKEMQAQRTQEARKRRKILIEEKQHKKSKQSSYLQRLGSRQSISPNDKFPLAGTPSSEDGVTPESQCVSPDVLNQDGQGKVRKDMIMIQNLRTEETKQKAHPQCMKDDKIKMLASSIDEVEGPSHDVHSKGGMSTHGNNTTCGVPLNDGVSSCLSREQNSGGHGSLMTSEFEQSTSVGDCVVGSKVLTSGNERNYGSFHNSHVGTGPTVHAGACMNEDEGGKSSETECVDSSSMQNSANMLQCTIEKGGVGVMASSALSTAAISYPPFPVLAVPYPYTVAATSPNFPVQPGFPFPFLMQYPGSSQCDNDSSSPHGTCSVVTGMTTGTSLPGALISKASSVYKDSVGESFEGKGSHSEKPAFTLPPLSRTASNLKHVKEEPQSLGIQLDSQATFPASQLSSFSSVVSDACNTKNLSLERQQSLPLGSRLLSQNSCALEQSTLCSTQERPILAERGNVRQETPSLRMGINTQVKQAEGVRQEEASMESQLASEHSGVDASYVQLGNVERQKSGSFPDLPWVTTTGKGPYGKTISGVMYIVNGRHVRLVCSCHGKHMSPAEFVEHSGSADLSNPERHIVVSPFPSFNHQIASAPFQTSNLES